MTNGHKSKRCGFSFITVAVTISLLYWSYIGFVSQIVIAHDAISYESFGRMVYLDGWDEYFRTGPNREPLYMFLIAVSMWMADILNVSYHEIQKIIQLLFLFITQLLTLKTLKRLRVSDYLIATALLYIGLSPGMVNSALSLFSEIATYPFVLSIVLVASKLWKNLKKESSPIAIPSSILGLLWLLLTFTKGIFELISSLFLIPFFIITGVAIRKQRSFLWKKCLIFFVMFFVSYYLPLNGYKLMNKIYNGHYALSDRGARILYGSTARRLEPMGKTNLLAGLAFAPTPDICYSHFDSQTCDFWDWSTADHLATTQLTQLGERGLSPNQAERQILWLAIKKILSNPLQYCLLTMVEGSSIFFWESSKIGFVAYPDWMDRIFWNSIFENALTFSTAFLALTAFIYLFIYIWKNRTDIFDTANLTDSRNATAFMIFLILTNYIMISCLFWILRRYVLPMAPLYVVIIIFFAHRLINVLKTTIRLRSS